MRLGESSAAADSRPLIVGEQNPYGGDDYYALYPYPDGCSGHRLCCLILGMDRMAYLRAFDRCNLVQQSKWSARLARLRAKEIVEQWPERRLILLGAKVTAAFGLRFQPFTVCGSILILPHPSGRNLIWNEAGKMELAREMVAQHCPGVITHA